MPQRDARALLLERVRSSPPKFVHVVGIPYLVEREPEVDPEKVDHVWITLEVPPFGRVRASVNTMSRLNRAAGFDARVRIGVVRFEQATRPAICLEEVDGLDYAHLESQYNIFYEHLDNDSLAGLLIQKVRQADRVEVWGELYARHHLGIHQIHSRRASCAVPLDLRNHDGALKLYHQDNGTAELFLFKFCGQP